MKTKNIDTIDKTVLDEALTRQVATIMLTGASVPACAKQLSITPGAVRRIVESDRYKELVSMTAEEELGPALAKAKSQLAKLSTKGVKVIEKAMDDYLGGKGGSRDALQASSLVLRAVGLHEEAEKQQDMNLTVVLPGQSMPTIIDVTNEKD